MTETCEINYAEKLSNIQACDKLILQEYEAFNTDSSDHSNSDEVNNNMPVMISGPSAVGKDTMINKLKAKYPKSIYKLPSFTTREKRPGEIEGVDYNFVTKEKFLEKQKEGLLFGVQEYNNNFYGSNLSKLKEALADKSKIVILNYNIETAIAVKDLHDFYFVAIFPPNEEALRERLIKRKTKTEEIESRMKQSVKEIQLMHEANFINFRMVNDDEERAFNELENQLKKIYPQLQYYE